MKLTELDSRGVSKVGRLYNNPDTKTKSDKITPQHFSAQKMLTFQNVTLLLRSRMLADMAPLSGETGVEWVIDFIKWKETFSLGL